MPALAGIESNINCTLPAIKSCPAGPLPRYGTCVMSTPVMNLNNSPARCGAPPWDEDA